MTHWDTFYTNTPSHITGESPFAKFCLQSMTMTNGYVLDIGCGNGRDTKFFARNNFQTIGIDQSSVVIESNSKQLSNIQFICSNVEGLAKIDFSGKKINYIYCRFFIHAISEIEAKKFIEWAYSILQENGKLFIECRSTNDELYGKGTRGPNPNEFIFGHYRRFVLIYDIVKDLNKFSIMHINESKGLSLSSNESDALAHNSDPTLIRIIGQKNSSFRRPPPNIYLLKNKEKLISFLKICNSRKINIFATCGTMLGAVRHQGFIPWDTDIDFGIVDTDLNSLLILLIELKYFMSSSGKINNEYKNFPIKDLSILNNFDTKTELLWIHDDTLFIQLHIMSEDPTYVPPYWKDFAPRDKFLIHASNDFKIGYNSGRYNIPRSLFYPLIKTKFYDTEVNINGKYKEILARWYGQNCLTNYPKCINCVTEDVSRFLSSDTKIEDFSPM